MLTNNIWGTSRPYFEQALVTGDLSGSGSSAPLEANERIPPVLSTGNILYLTTELFTHQLKVEILKSVYLGFRSPTSING